MCVIIHKPAGVPLYKKRLQRLWQINSDGGGIAYIDPIAQTIQVSKHLTWDSFWKDYRDISQSIGPDSPMLIHMRIATHGSVCLENTHPFWVNEHTVMAHNGVIHKYSAKDELSAKLKEELGAEDVSDTRLFIQDVVRHLPENWLDNPGLVRLVKDYIGPSSKLMFLTTHPDLKSKVYILNMAAGTVDGGLWFSNSNGVRELPLYTPPVVHYSRNRDYAGEYTYEQMRQRYPRFPAREEPTKPLWSESQIPRIERTILDVSYSGTAEELMLLKARRHNLGIVTAIHEDKESGGWVCLACDNKLDPEDYYCGCWDVICIECEQFSAECKCTDGIPEATILYDNFIASKGGKMNEVPKLFIPNQSPAMSEANARIALALA